MFGKKKKPFNPYESRADDALYEVWGNARPPL